MNSAEFSSLMTSYKLASVARSHQRNIKSKRSVKGKARHVGREDLKNVHIHSMSVESQPFQRRKN